MTLTLSRHKLSSEAKAFLFTDVQELAVHLLAGSCTATVGPRTFKLGPRTNPFDELPTTLLLTGDFSITAEGHADLLVATGPVGAGRPPLLLRPQDVDVHQIGEGTHRRTVRPVVTQQCAPYRIRLGETINPPGHWSSWPVHKGEAASQDFDEFFFYLAKPADGFGIQVRPGHPPSFVCAGEILQIPQGCHPVVSGPDTTLLYVWAFVSDFEKKYSRFADEPVGMYAT